MAADLTTLNYFCVILINFSNCAAKLLEIIESQVFFLL